MSGRLRFGGLLLAAWCSASPGLAQSAVAPEPVFADLEDVLRAAGRNRAALEDALLRYDPDTQPLEHAAMRWLVRHLEGHGHAQLAWFNPRGEPVEIPLAVFADPAHLAEAWRVLEARHGRLQPGLLRFESDVLSLTAAELEAHVEGAIRAWRERPWAAELSAEDFHAWVLPHRAGDEALDDWRRILFTAFSGLEGELADPRDPLAAAAWIQRSVRNWVDFAPGYAWHLTDQSCTEMLASRRGRSEDLAHLEVLALRANALPAAVDFVPAWGNRTGNHAWARLLLDQADAVPLPAAIAKVYRRSHEVNPESWAGRAAAGEPLPVWLADPHMRDVTSAYTAVSTVGVALERRPQRSALAFACVWDGQAWTPVAAGLCSDEGSFATFRDLGRDVVYLPAWYDGTTVHPAGSPFLLDRRGATRRLDGLGFASPGELLAMDEGAPFLPGGHAVPERPALRLDAQRDWQLLCWQNGAWQEVARRAAGSAAPYWEIPRKRLLLLQPTEGTEAAARPWTLGLAGPRWW